MPTAEQLVYLNNGINWNSHVNRKLNMQMSFIQRCRLYCTQLLPFSDCAAFNTFAWECSTAHFTTIQTFKSIHRHRTYTFTLSLYWNSGAVVQMSNELNTVNKPTVTTHNYIRITSCWELPYRICLCTKQDRAARKAKYTNNIKWKKTQAI